MTNKKTIAAKARKQLENELREEIKDIMVEELRKDFPDFNKNMVDVTLHRGEDGIEVTTKIHYADLGVSRHKANALFKRHADKIDERISTLIDDTKTEKEQQIDALEQHKAALVESIKELAKRHDTEPDEEWREMYEDIHKRLVKKPRRKDDVDCFRDFFDNLIDGFFK